MSVQVDDLGYGYPTFPHFQRMLRDYERDLDAEKNKPDVYVGRQQITQAMLRHLPVMRCARCGADYLKGYKACSCHPTIIFREVARF